MSWQGSVVAIHVAPTGGAAMQARQAVRAVPGKGLEGDRYFEKSGTYSRTEGSGREVTLIEAEAVEALHSEYGVKLAPGDSRRNLTVRGVPLNHLVGREFLVGSARLRGARLCEPCGHMERLSAKPGARKGLVHRGGLRCDVVGEGDIRVGDAVREG